MDTFRGKFGPAFKCLVLSLKDNVAAPCSMLEQTHIFDNSFVHSDINPESRPVETVPQLWYYDDALFRHMVC